MSVVVSTFEVGWTNNVQLAEYIYEILHLGLIILNWVAKRLYLCTCNNTSNKTKTHRVFVCFMIVSVLFYNFSKACWSSTSKKTWCAHSRLFQADSFPSCVVDWSLRPPHKARSASPWLVQVQVSHPYKCLCWSRCRGSFNMLFTGQVNMGRLLDVWHLLGSATSTKALSWLSTRNLDRSTLLHLHNCALQ